MPQIPHLERHFTGSDMLRDIVIGMSDGLTVPFALAAGLSGTVESTSVIVTAGLAEIAAGSIAMGLGGYLAGQSDAQHYRAERKREEQEVAEKTEVEAEEVSEIFRTYGLTPEEVAPLVDALKKRPEAWVDFMMRFELGLERPEPRRALWSALTIATAYVVGGLVPLGPYIVLGRSSAFSASVVTTLTVLAVFGYVKGRFTGVSGLKSGLQAVLVGGLAAAVAFALARLIA